LAGAIHHRVRLASPLPVYRGSEARLKAEADPPHRKANWLRKRISNQRAAKRVNKQVCQGTRLSPAAVNRCKTHGGAGPCGGPGGGAGGTSVDACTVRGCLDDTTRRVEDCVQSSLPCESYLRMLPVSGSYNSALLQTGQLARMALPPATRTFPLVSRVTV
jgi:hypothetical protein